MESAKQAIERIKCRCIQGAVIRPVYGLRIYGTKYTVPLKSIDYTTSIVNGIAETTLTQVYYNPYDLFLETEYFLPTSEKVCFTGFKAIYEGNEITGLIKEKEKAKKEYEDLKNAGNVVGFSEINEASSDILKIKLGNIEPNKSITIKMTYIEELEVCSSNKLWKHTVYSIVRPRYTPSESTNSQDAIEISNVPQIKEEDYKIPQKHTDYSIIRPRYNASESTNSQDAIKISNMPQIKEEDCGHPPYTWKIQTTISHETPLSFIKSTTHDIKVDSKDKSTTVTISTDNQNNIPSRDFVLLFRDESISKPRAILGKVTDDSGTRLSANVTFVPNFSNLDVEDALKAQIKSSDEEDFDLDFDSARGEYIFLLDRSGSMSGKRMETAKDSLILFLKSLPAESFYNVFSFGTSFQKLHHESTKVEKKQMAKDLDTIKKFSADMGGTEILTPLVSLSKVSPRKNFPRQIFLLTDGDVSNVEQVLRTISDESKRSRVHTIGIGSGASTKLIKDGAKEGRGKALLLNDNEDVTGKIIDLLQKTLTPALDDFKIIFDKELVDIVAPNPETMGCVMKNEPFSLSILFKNQIKTPFQTDIRIKFYDSFAKTHLEYSLKIDSETCEVHESVHKYAAYKYLKDLLRNSKRNSNYSQDIFLARKIDIENEIVETSIREQILTEKTAFICLIKEATDSLIIEKEIKGQAKFIVPTYASPEDIQPKKEIISKSKMSAPSLSIAPKKKAMLSAARSRGSAAPHFNDVDLMMKCAELPDSSREFKSAAEARPKSGGGFLSKAKDAIGNLFSGPSKKKASMPSSSVSVNSLSKAENVKEKKEEFMIRDHRFKDEEEEDIEEVPAYNKVPPKKKLKNLEQKRSLPSAELSSKSERFDQEEKKASITIPKSDKATLMNVLTLQETNGSWEASSNLFKGLGSTEEVIRALIPQELKEKIKEEKSLFNLFITIYVVAWLKKHHSENENSWKLMAKKSQQYLNQVLKKDLSIEWESTYLTSLIENI